MRRPARRLVLWRQAQSAAVPKVAHNSRALPPPPPPPPAPPPPPPPPRAGRAAAGGRGARAGAAGARPPPPRYITAIAVGWVTFLASMAASGPPGRERRLAAPGVAIAAEHGGGGVKVE